MRGRLANAVYDPSDGSVSGKGTLTLKRDLDRSTSDGKWTIRIAKGTNVDAVVRKNNLDSIGGDIVVQVDDAEGKLAQGKFGDATIDLETWETSGQLLAHHRPKVLPSGRRAADGQRVWPCGHAGHRSQGHRQERRVV